MKPKKKRFPDEDVINHAVPSVLRDVDMTAIRNRITVATGFEQPPGGLQLWHAAE